MIKVVAMSFGILASFFSLTEMSYGKLNPNQTGAKFVSMYNKIRTPVELIEKTKYSMAKSTVKILVEYVQKNKVSKLPTLFHKNGRYSMQLKNFSVDFSVPQKGSTMVEVQGRQFQFSQNSDKLTRFLNQVESHLKVVLKSQNQEKNVWKFGFGSMAFASDITSIKSSLSVLIFSITSVMSSFDHNYLEQLQALVGSLEQLRKECSHRFKTLVRNNPSPVSDCDGDPAVCSPRDDTKTEAETVHPNSPVDIERSFSHESEKLLKEFADIAERSSFHCSSEKKTQQTSEPIDWTYDTFKNRVNSLLGKGKIIDSPQIFHKWGCLIKRELRSCQSMVILYSKPHSARFNGGLNQDTRPNGIKHRMPQHQMGIDSGTGKSTAPGNQ